MIASIEKVLPTSSLDYTEHLCQDKEIQGVSNVPRQNAHKFQALVGRISVQPEIEQFKMFHISQALKLIKQSRLKTAAVLRIQ